MKKVPQTKLAWSHTVHLNEFLHNEKDHSEASELHSGVHTFTINYIFVDLANTTDYDSVETQKKT